MAERYIGRRYGIALHDGPLCAVDIADCYRGTVETRRLLLLSPLDIHLAERLHERLSLSHVASDPSLIDSVVSGTRCPSDSSGAEVSVLHYVYSHGRLIKDINGRSPRDGL